MKKQRALRRARTRRQRKTSTWTPTLERLENRIVLTGMSPTAANDLYVIGANTVLNEGTPGVLANDTDPESDPLTAQLFNGPQNGSLSLNADGSFTYTPDLDFTGFDSFTYQAHDGTSASGLAAVTIRVNAGDSVPVAVDDSYSVDEDETLIVNAGAGVLANDTDGDGDPLTALLQTSPSSGSLTLDSDGSFEYTPDPNFFGTDTFTYFADDGVNESNLATVTITVDPVNDAPVAENDSYSTDEDTTLVVSAGDGVLDNDSDIDGDSLEAVLVSSPSNGTLTLNPDGSFEYTPDADFFGTDGFTYVADDGTEDSNVAAVTIIVDPINDAPVAENDAYETDEDTTLTIPAAGVLGNDTDVDGDPLEAVLVSGPTNGTLTLNPDGSFEYTPDLDFFGADSFLYNADDGLLGSNTATVTITVNPINDAPVAENDSYDTDEDTTLTVPADGVLDNDSDVEGDSLESVLVTGPSNGTLTLNPDGSFEYTPDADFFGTDGFTYVANDGNDDSNVAAVTIIVNPINDAPVAENDSYNTDEDTTLTVPADGVLGNDTDVDGDPLEAVLVSGPTNGTLTLNPDGSFEYTPDADFFGTDGFTYVADDGTEDSNVAAVTIIVDPVNDAPVAENDLYDTDEDTTLTVPADGVLGNDSDVEGDPLESVLVTGPTNGTLTLNPDGSFEYTPDADFFGTDGFTYVANDGNDDSNVAAVTIIVNPINDAPVAVNDLFDTDEDTTLTVPTDGVLGNDTDVDGDPLEAVLVSGPTNGTLTLNPDGSFEYTPDPDFFGTDGFTYIADDGIEDSNVAAVTIIVNPINDAPVAENDSYNTDEDTTLTVPADGVLGNDTDVDGDPLEAVLVSGPTNGTLTLNPDGSFEYTPDADFFGTDGFTYVADDGLEDSNVAAVTIIVDPVNDAPLGVNDTYNTDEDTTLTVPADGVLDNDSDIEGDPLTAVLVGGPSHGSLTLNPDGSFEYTPDPDFFGTDGFTYAANDGSLDSNVTAVTILVAPIQDPPMAENDEYDVDEDTTLTVPADGVLDNDWDVDGDPLTSWLVSGPTNGTLWLNPDGSFEYTPDPNFNGTDGFTYVANDGIEDSNVAAVTIIVNPVNDAPLAHDDAYSVGEDNTLSTDEYNGVLLNDFDIDGDDLEALLVDDVSNGTLWLNLDGSFEYTPDPDFFGTDVFTYQASDDYEGGLLSNVATVVITVDPVNDPPEVEDDKYYAKTDTPLVIDAPEGILSNDFDIEGDTLTAIHLVGPEHGALTLNPDGSFTYTPDPGFEGEDGFIYQAFDGKANSLLGFVEICVEENEPPEADNDEYGGEEDTPLVVDAASGVLSNDFDADGDPLTAVWQSGPSNGSLTLNPDGSFEYTPDPNFFGSDSFTYLADDGDALSNVATVHLFISPVNDPPHAQDDDYNTDEDTTLVVPADGVLDNDTDVEGDSLTANLVTGPSNGSLTLNPDGSFEYTPDGGFSGTDSFTYQPHDGTDPGNTATVTIVVEPAFNSAPAAVNDFYEIDQDTVLNVPAAGVLDNDSDPQGDPITANLFAGPSHGTLTLNPDGSFTYTPDSGFSGVDSFTYQANDGSLNSTLAAVTIRVIEAEAEGEQPLLAPPAATTLLAAPLAPADLGQTAQAALSFWNSTLSPGSLSLAIEDLPGDLLGRAEGGRIIVDINAAGHGWFVDATPGLNEEFTPAGATSYAAVKGGPADGRIDLLTVVLHEMGHLLGLSDKEPGLSGDLMESLLMPGTRKQVVAESLDELFASGDWSV